MTTDTPVAPVASEPQRQSFFARVMGALMSPFETFADIARKPDILAPLLLLIIVGYASVVLVMPRMDFGAIVQAQEEAMRKQNPNLKDEDLDRMERFTSGLTKVMGWVSPLLAVVWYVIVAAVLFGAFRMMGGEGTFKQAFSATLYAWLPLTLFGVITTIVVVARGSFDPTTAPTLVKSNPAFLVDMKEQPVLFSALSSFDLFTIWTVFLLAVGFSAFSRFSKAKSATIIVSLWIVMILIKVGFAAMGAARMSS